MKKINLKKILVELAKLVKPDWKRVLLLFAIVFATNAVVWAGIIRGYSDAYVITLNILSPAALISIPKGYAGIFVFAANSSLNIMWKYILACAISFAGEKSFTLVKRSKKKKIVRRVRR